MSDLEKDFEEVSKKINAKLKEAAEAISEASKLSEEFGLNGQLIHTQWSEDIDYDLEIDEEEYDPVGIIEYLFEQIDVSDLEVALDTAGWQTSSSYC